MPNFTVSTDVDSFMQGADFAAMRTSLGVTAETDAREEADNRRAFSGGVAFDGNNLGHLNAAIALNQISASAFTLYFKGNIDDVSHPDRGANILGNLQGVSTYSAGNYGLEYRKNTKLIKFRSEIGATSTVSSSGFLIDLKESVEVLCTVDPITERVILYKNGVEEVNEIITGLDLSSSNTFKIFGNRQNSTPTTYAHATGTASDVAILNTALTSAQAAEIHRDGMQPWLAANPEYRKGEDRYFSDYSAGIDGGTASNVIATGDNDGVTDGTTSYDDVLKIVADTANNQKSFAFPIATKVKANDPDIYSFKFKYFIPSGTNITTLWWYVANTGLLSFFGAGSNFNQTGTWVQVERVGTITATSSTNAALKIYLNGSSTFTGDGVNDIVYIRDVELVKLGALANLPLDDERSLLRDISGNGNHATASETGVTHLKSSPVTLDTVDTLTAADNRRAFSGGVYFDGSVVSRAEITDLKLNEISATNFTLFFKGTVDEVSITNKYGNLLGSVRGVGTYVAGNFGLGYNNLNGGQVAFISQTGATTTVKTSNVSCTLHTPFEIACTVNPTTGQVVIYKDGAQVLDETLSGMDLSGTGSCLIFGNQAGADSTIYSHPTGTASDLAILNTALTSTQAAEIYRDGMQPWLAVNPEYRKAEDRYASDYSAGVDGGTASNVIATGDNDGVTDGTTSYDDVLKVVANTATTQKRFEFPIATKVTANDPDIYSFKFKYFIPSGTNITNIRWMVAGTGLSSFFGGSSFFTETGTWTQVERVGTITASSTTSNALYIFLNGATTFTGDGVNDIVYIRDVELVKLGALANLPLDDDSRQLKDISGNRNDATASETGVTHLIQKDIHSFRDDNADGTGGSYLIANSDILAENEVITGVTMDGRFYAATEAQDLTKRRIKLVTSGSHIEIKRSDGTTDDAANVTTHPASTTDFAVNVLTQRI